jgi:hypothetical protein
MDANHQSYIETPSQAIFLSSLVTRFKSSLRTLVFQEQAMIWQHFAVHRSTLGPPKFTRTEVIRQPWTSGPLDVLVFALAHGLPVPQGYGGRHWCERIVEEVNDCDCEGLIDFLSNAMIVMGPEAATFSLVLLQGSIAAPYPIPRTLSNPNSNLLC